MYVYSPSSLMVHRLVTVCVYSMARGIHIIAALLASERQCSERDKGVFVAIILSCL